jgi:RNA polymerase II subunit A C-terminal domain phosphatase SSU72
MKFKWIRKCVSIFHGQLSRRTTEGRAESKEKMTSDLVFCTVCASNQNRSMEAHRLLKEAGFEVSSFGTGSAVRLPGPSVDKPVIYNFGTPYNDMYNELSSRDRKLYTSNGVLNMLDRNRQIKDHPERWHEHHKLFDVIFTCEERCFDAVCIDLMTRGAKLNRMVHVINVDIKDNREQAAIGGKAILSLASKLSTCRDVDSEIIAILADWQDENKTLPVLHQVCYF